MCSEYRTVRIIVFQNLKKNSEFFSKIVYSEDL
jgi:hypothetical protein